MLNPKTSESCPNDPAEPRLHSQARVLTLWAGYGAFRPFGPSELITAKTPEQKLVNVMSGLVSRPTLNLQAHQQTRFRGYV